ncbi:MAG: hypothetical protein ACE5EG_10305, partial [Thermoanaerobaculia bacterium]
MMAAAAAAAGLTFRRQRAEPAHLWVRYRPSSWPGPEEPWLDLATGVFGVSRRGASLEIPEPRLDALDDLVYLPPVGAEITPARERLAARLEERGLPVLLQLRPGEEEAPAPAVNLFDPLEILLAGRLEPLADLPPGSTVVWGLVAGITDDFELCRRALETLAEAGVLRVLPLAPRLEPRQKRQLAGADEMLFARLFHGAPPDARAFARLAAAAGLATRLDRPAAPVGTPRPGNRRVAARLAQIADLWLALDRPEADAQELFRAARWI